MKTFFQSRDGASKGAALLITLALVVLLTGLALAYFSRTTNDRQLAHSSYHDTSADLLARSALDIVVNDFKQEILNNPTITRSNIQPSPYPSPIPTDIANLVRYSSRNAVPSRASNVSSADISANGRSISTARWNSHYLVPRGTISANVDSSPVPSFSPPDWVLVTAQGPTPSPLPNDVIGRYAFAVYDEGGLLDMTLAGYPNWASPPSAGCDPAPTPWMLNVGRKGIVAFADLTALPFAGPTPQSQIDKIVGWRNYAMSQQTGSFFPSGNPSFPADCTRQNWYGSYLLYFGDPPFTIESLADKLGASLYPFTSVAGYVYPTPAPGLTPRTDQSLVTRQQLLKLRSSLGFSQDVLQYMGTFSRERNWPAPDWPNLSDTGALSEGRFNMNNLAMVIPNPAQCIIPHGKKVGWLKGKNKNRLCGTTSQIIELFGMVWVPHADDRTPGYWKYIEHTGPNPPGEPDPNPHSVICFRGANQQSDFFQVLHYALSVARTVDGTERCGGRGQQPRTFSIGASLIDQYDSGGEITSVGYPCEHQQFGANPPRQLEGCDLDAGVTDQKYATHTTVIKYGQGGGPNTAFASGMEKNYDPLTGDGDWTFDDNSSHPHRPCDNKGAHCVPQQSPAPTPVASTQVINHAFTNVGEFGYGMDTSVTSGPTPLPMLRFWDNTNNPPVYYPFQDAPVLDFFCYNPISSAYPRAGIVNLYTKNKEVIAAMLKSALQADSLAPSPTPVVSHADAMAAAQAIVNETQRVLAGSPTYGSVQQTDLTRAIAGRLSKAAADAVSNFNATNETRNTVARALAEMGQTRTWNLFIDVIAQTGKYKPNAPDLTASNFIVEGEKRYWLHIALGRDLVQADGTPCAPGLSTGCQVDVLGTQLEEVIE
jgi:hypothetical protein